MKEMVEKVKQLLRDGDIAGFIGLKEQHGHPVPHVFTRDNMEELESLVIGNIRYPLTKVLLKVVDRYTDDHFGVMVRGCDERTLKELFKWNQLHRDRVIPVGIACPPEQAEACECPKPYPSEWVTGEKTQGIPKSKRLEEREKLSREERLHYWTNQFNKCIKCYGCRDVCPMCFCQVCSLEDPSFILTGKIPPENPTFHLARAVHMVGRCIDCGLCEEACPVDIAVRILYKKVGEIVSGLFDYRTGEDLEGRSPLNILGEIPLDRTDM
ncbi:MAG: 4Fe-4S binding protein [Deltaproteobacteria bacterium]|nr:4Fe-4S binding protein [Deltaproteobacteria bacterium]